MLQKEFIVALTNNKQLDLVVTVKDTTELLIKAKFLALTFDASNSNVVMKLEVSTTTKNVVLNNGNDTSPMPPVITSKLLRADENTQIAVIDENDNIVLDTNGEPLTIPENIYWKYLAWENPLSIPFKPLIEAAINIKFNTGASYPTLKINRADYPGLAIV